MLDKLQQIEDKYIQLREELYKPEVASDIQKSMEIWKKLADMEEVYNIYQLYKNCLWQISEAKEIIEMWDDVEMTELAKAQLKENEDKLPEIENQLKIALLPKDPNDDKNIFLEIRPAAWWDEAWLFAAELLRAYLMYAQAQWWKTEIIEEQLSDIWWVKFVMVKISWDKVYSKLKFESWVHRVQRIPDTETNGRIHTSTITVAIMPEVEDVDVQINPADVTMDTYAASSCGWQNANKNQTWVRLHHKPTWLIVTIWDTKSQLQNKEKAWSVLKARLYQMELEKKQSEESTARLDQIWSWDRSEKIRTYNFPQDRVTDHRIKQSWSNLPWIMSWQMDDIVHAMVVENQSMQLSANKE